mgnify:CR=1 FL=1
MEIEKRKITIALVCGMLGCLCFGSGDWLMLYGDTAHDGSVYWLTHGTAQIPAWRNTLAMALAFPDWFYKWSDEREHDYLVRNYAGVEFVPETGCGARKRAERKEWILT